MVIRKIWPKIWLASHDSFGPLNLGPSLRLCKWWIHFDVSSLFNLVITMH